MNKHEHRVLQLEMRVSALQVLLQCLIRGLGPVKPAWKIQALEIASRKTIPAADPATSDLMAAEFQDALQELLDGL